jgi:quinol monooxygenase YgiN/mannose-6-phosphate isomerase-like protein (cupin superfamily)
MSENGYVTRYGKATAKPGKGAELGELLVEAASQNSQGEGCLQYEVNVAADDPDTIWVTEKWTSREAIEASLENEDTKVLISQARPLIEDMEMVELKPLGGIGAGPAEPQPGYTLMGIDEIPDRAPDFGMDDIHEARFGTKALSLTQTGFSHFNLKPGVRQPFGHHHNVGEEVHVVLDGFGRVKLDNEILALQAGDVLRVGPEVMRAFEGGPEGLEFIIFSQHIEKDTEMERGWWSD